MGALAHGKHVRPFRMLPISDLLILLTAAFIWTLLGRLEHTGRGEPASNEMPPEIDQDTYES
jgi:hypothetical protein